MTLIVNNVTEIKPNLKGRLLARLNGESERIQNKIGKLRFEIKEYEDELKRLQEERTWAKEKISDESSVSYLDGVEQ